MKKNFQRVILAVMLLMNWSLAAGISDIDKARRITGYYDSDGPIADVPVKKWDPMSEAARKYVRHMQSQPSRIFVVKECCDMPKQITSLEDLEDIVLDMHFGLECRRKITLGAGVSDADLQEWIKKVNTLQHLYVEKRENCSGPYLRVWYFSDARVFAAFRNPNLNVQLCPKEEELLKVCCQWITDNIQEGMPNLLKIKKLHDAIVDNSKYTCGYYDTYNLVVNGKGVCAAYTSATQLLLHMMKIDCRSVLGTKKMNHIWNIIDVNGEWYHTDVTWDDPVTKNGENCRQVRYFLLSRAEMECDHEWDNPETYPETPAISRLGIFKRHDKRELMARGEPQEEAEYPRERESIFNSILEMRRQEIEQQGDKLEPVVAPVVKNANSVALKVEKTLRGVTPSVPHHKQRNAEKKEYKVIQTLDDFYHNLEICRDSLDGPTVEFELDNVSDCTISTLSMAEIHRYVKYWNFRVDKKKKKLLLDVEHWPHIRILRAHADDELAVDKLSAGERLCLSECRKLAETYGTVWKTDRQKLADVYEKLIRDVKWKFGQSGILDAMQESESGSLGFSEALHVVLSMMNIPSQLVHGRTEKNVHVWLVMRRMNKKWYHVDVALDAEEENRHRSKFKYMLRCDDEMFDSHVWDLKEVPPTPIKDRNKASKQGLIREDISRDFRMPELF